MRDSRNTSRNRAYTSVLALRLPLLQMYVSRNQWLCLVDATASGGAEIYDCHGTNSGSSKQVLFSQTTCNLVDHDLAEDMSLRDVGEYHLKDLGHPRHLFQLVISGLPADFPPPRALHTPHPK